MYNGCMWNKQCKLSFRAPASQMLRDRFNFNLNIPVANRITTKGDLYNMGPPFYQQWWTKPISGLGHGWLITSTYRTLRCNAQPRPNFNIKSRHENTIYMPLFTWMYLLIRALIPIQVCLVSKWYRRYNIRGKFLHESRGNLHRLRSVNMPNVSIWRNFRLSVYRSV